MIFNDDRTFTVCFCFVAMMISLIYRRNFVAIILLVSYVLLALILGEISAYRLRSGVRRVRRRYLCIYFDGASNIKFLLRIAIANQID
jgi:hypothetical protein